MLIDVFESQVAFVFSALGSELETNLRSCSRLPVSLNKLLFLISLANGARHPHLPNK
jgi:hypothetical protein